MPAPNSEVKKKNRSPKHVSSDKWEQIISDGEQLVKQTEVKLSRLRRSIEIFREMKEAEVAWPNSKSELARLLRLNG